MVLKNAFWALGGVPKVVLFDNASCAVKNPDWYDSELHPKILDFCKHYGFVLTTTKPRTPRHKGKVERGVGYVKNSAIKDREFDSVAAQNEFLKNWEATVADTRIHGTTKRHPWPSRNWQESSCAVHWYVSYTLWVHSLLSIDLRCR